MSDPLWYKNVKGVGAKTADDLLAKLEKYSVLGAGAVPALDADQGQTET